MDNEGLFSPIDPSPSATNQYSTGPSTNFVLGAAVGDVDDDTEALLDAVSLDAYSDDGDTDNSPEDEDEGDEVFEVAAVGATAEKMDVDKGIKTPRLPYEGYEKAVPFRAGCVWTRNDWSCAYDVAFMAFFAIYSQSSVSWRGDWKQQSPEWTARLADRFDLLLEASTSPDHSPETLSEWFSSLRDQLRDQLSSHNPQMFPRRGPFLASICDILELLFGSVDGPGIEQHLFCASCRTTLQVSRHFPLLALPVFPTNYRRKTDPQFVPVDTLFTRFIESLVTPSSPSPCRVCQGTTHMQSLSMTNFPWIWFEVKGNNTMSPSLTLPIELSGRHLVYDLYSIIYIGENHFTARMRDPSNEWWSYDGMWRFGSPRRDRIQIATDLLYNGRRCAAFFIYRRSDH